MSLKWLVLWLVLTPPSFLHAAEESTGQTFTSSVSVSGTTGLIGDEVEFVGGNETGAVNLFRNLDTAVGTITQSVTLTASDGAAGDFFGGSASLSGTLALVGASAAKVTGVTDAGAAYVFRNLGTASGTITQNVKLIASDGSTDASFGISTSLASTTGSAGMVGLVGAYEGVVGGVEQGAAYVYRNLDTVATGTITQSLKLTASDGASGDQFGLGVGLSSTAGSAGLIGVVGASFATVSGHTRQGAAYVFHNLDTAAGTITQSAKLVASDGAANDDFGDTVSLSGTMGLVSAIDANIGSNSNQGAAYLFRGLDTATGSVTQSAKLIASDGAASDNFGSSLSLSGTTALVGYENSITQTHGAAYLFLNLGTATGTISQDVKITESNSSNDSFGVPLSLDGDNFIIGTNFAGKGYSGSVSSLTTMDAGNISRTISGISFVSQDDWIIGQTTSNNSVTLSATDAANVTAAGKAVFIGQNAGSNNNTLEVLGKLTANSITVGETGDTLWVQGDASGDGQVTASGGVTVKSGAVLKGTPIGTSGFAGTITSVVSLQSGATITGSLNLVGSQTLVGGAAYAWNVNAAPASGTAATNWDFINITGGLNITATSGNQFTIDIDGSVSGLTANQLYDWAILTASNGFGGTFSASEFTLNAIGFTSNTGGTFSVLAQGNNLELQFASAPEPGRVMLLGLGVTAVLMRRRRQNGYAA